MKTIKLTTIVLLLFTVLISTYAIDPFKIERKEINYKGETYIMGDSYIYNKKMLSNFEGVTSLSLHPGEYRFDAVFSRPEIMRMRQKTDSIARTVIPEVSKCDVFAGYYFEVKTGNFLGFYLSSSSRNMNYLMTPENYSLIDNKLHEAHLNIGIQKVEEPDKKCFCL